MGFHVAISSDINGLARALGEQLQRDLQSGSLDLFHPASIIVPHANLARWISLRLAHQLGVAANLDFPYLEQALWAIMRNRHGDDHIERLDAGTLQRLLLSLFEQPFLKDFTELAPVWAYIGNSQAPDAQWRAWQLCDRMARLFLEYECQRLAMIAVWQHNRLHDDPALDARTQAWQQRLYYELFREGGWRDRTLPHRRLATTGRAVR